MVLWAGLGKKGWRAVEAEARKLGFCVPELTFAWAPSEVTGAPSQHRGSVLPNLQPRKLISEQFTNTMEVTAYISVEGLSGPQLHFPPLRLLLLLSSWLCFVGVAGDLARI